MEQRYRDRGDPMGMATIEESRAAIRRLAPGDAVGHANPQLADWEGTVAPAARGRMADLGRDVRVKWHAGSVDGDGREPLPGLPNPRAYWMDATALTVKGICPDCGQPGYFVSAGNDWRRAEGWHHEPTGVLPCSRDFAGQPVPWDAAGQQVMCKGCGTSYECTPEDDYYAKLGEIITGPDAGWCMRCLAPGARIITLDVSGENAPEAGTTLRTEGER